MDGLTPQELLFAKIALEQGLIGKENIQKCLAMKKGSQPSLALEELLLQLRLLDREKIERIKQLLRHRIRSQSTYTKEDLEDSIFGKLALQNRLLTQEQIRWALSKQRELEQKGILKRLGEVFIEAGLLSAPQVAHILTHQRSRILICPVCHSHYNLAQSQVNQKCQCKKCGTIIEVAAQGSSAGGDSVYDTSYDTSGMKSAPEEKEPETIYADPTPSTSKSQFANPHFGQSSSQIRPPRPSSLMFQGQGRVFGRYQILSQIAKGGMGIVYKAKDLPLDRVVALKTLIAGEHASGEVIQRFLVEAKSAAKLRHPNIVAIHEVGNEEGMYFFTMDYIEGLPFNKVIGQHPSQEEVVLIMIKVCEAIYFAHDNHIIHRDLKPSNIIIDQAGEPQIMDFGLAKEVDSETDLTKTGATIGTPSYMPPEQASGYTDQVDHLSDIYSLGSILYEALTFKKPFEGPTSMSIIYKVITQDPTAPRKVNPQIPQDLETIVLKAMDKEKDRRYTSALEMAEDLARYMQGETIQARPTSPLYKGWKKIRQNRLSFALSCVFLLIFAILGFVFLHQYKKEKAIQKKIQVASLLKEVEGALREGRLLGAQKILVKMIKLDPNNPRAYLYMAKIYRRTKEYSSARQYIKKSLKLQKSGPAYFEMGRVEEEEKKLARAIQWYSRAIQQDSSYLEAYERRKEIYKTQGKLARALEDSKKIQSLRKKRAGADIQKAAQLLGQGEWIQSLHYLNRAVLAQPTNGQIYLLRSRCYQALEENKKAIEDISKAISLAPKVEYYFRRAEILTHFGRLGKALLDYQQICKLQPSNPKARVRMAQLYYRQKRYLYALSAYKEAQESKANSFSFYHGFSALYLKLRRFQKALLYSDLALRKIPHNLDALYVKGRAYFSLKDYTKSLQYLREVYKKNQTPQMSLQMARCWIELKEYTRALEVLSNIKITFPDMHYERARIYLAQHHYKRALREIDLAITRSHLPRSHYYELRGDIHFKLVLYRRAFDDFEVAQEVDWRNFRSFYKIFYTTMAGFLWHEAIANIKGGKGWITEVVRRQWSYKTSLFHPEEQEVLERYDQKVGEQSLSTAQDSSTSFRDALASLRSGIGDMEKIGKNYLLKKGALALASLRTAIAESSNSREKLLLKELIEKIKKGSEKEKMQKIQGYLVRLYINRDILARKKLFELGEKRFELLKKILQDPSRHLLIRFYAVKEVYSVTKKKNRQFVEDLLGLNNSSSVLAALAMADNYQVSLSVRKALEKGLFLSDPLLNALALSRLTLNGSNLVYLQKLLSTSKDHRTRLLCAKKIFLFNQSQRALRILVESLAWEDPNIRIYLAQTLAQSRNIQVVPYLQSLQNDKDPEVRLAAILAMRLFPAEKIFPNLVRGLKDESTAVKIHSLVILDRMAMTDKVVSILYNILKNPRANFYLRLLVFYSLKRLRSLPVLFQFATLLPKLVKDPNPVMRMMIIIAMAFTTVSKKTQQFFPMILDIVKKGLKDKVAFVRGGAIMALAMLNAGRDYVPMFIKKIKEHPRDIIGVSSASALVISKLVNQMKIPNYWKILINATPYVRRGASYGYWYFADQRRTFLGKKIAPLSFRAKEKLLKKALILYPNDYELNLSIIDTYMKNQKYDQARKYMEKLLKTTSRNRKVLKEVSATYKDLGEKKRAIEIYNKWIQLYPNDYRPYLEKGDLLPPGEERSKNLHYALLALAHPSTDKEFIHKRAILLRFGLEKEAQAVLEKGVVDNGSEKLYKAKLRMLMKKKHYQKALECVAILFKISPEPVREVYFARGVCLMKMGKYNQARKDFEGLLRKKTFFGMQVHINIAYCLDKMGRPKYAEKWYNYISKFKTGRAYCAVAMYHQRHGRYIQALSLLKNAPEDLYYRNTLALMALNFAMQNKNIKAVQHFKKALKKNFKNLEWLKEQPGYEKALRILGFRDLLKILK